MAKNQENNNNEQLPVTEESLSEALKLINSVTNSDGSLNLDALKDSPDALQALALIVGNSRNLGTISGDVNVVGQANTIVNIVLNNPTQVEKALGKDAYNSIVNAPAATGNAEAENAKPKKRRKKTQEKDINVTISIGLTEGEFNLAAFLRENTELSNEQIADYCKDTKNPTKLFRNRKLKKLAEKINNLPEAIATKYNETHSTSISKEDILRHPQRADLAEDIKVLSIARLQEKILLDTASKYTKDPVGKISTDKVSQIIKTLMAKDEELGKVSITEPLYKQYQEDKKAIEWEILREVPKKMIKPDALSETKMNQLTKDQSSRFKYRLIAVMLTVATLATLALNQLSYKQGVEAGAIDDLGVFETIENETQEQNKDTEQENENKVDQAPEQEKNEDNIEQGDTQKPEDTQQSEAELIQESIKKFQNSIDAKLSNHSNVDATSVKVGHDEIVIKTNNNKELTIKTDKAAELENLSPVEYYSKLSEIVASSKDYTYITIQEKSYEVATGITQKMILNQVQETLKTNEYADLEHVKADDSNVYIHTNGNITTIKTKIADKEFELDFTLDSRGVLNQEEIETVLKYHLEGHSMKNVAVSLKDINIYDADLETTIGQ